MQSEECEAQIVCLGEGNVQTDTDRSAVLGAVMEYQSMGLRGNIGPVLAMFSHCWVIWGQGRWERGGGTEEKERGHNGLPGEGQVVH